MKYDAFICHASEDKEDFVRPLAELLRQQDINVWYDEFSLTIGDSLREKIDEGLSKSRFGIVILSPSFFSKPWAKRELAGLTAREIFENNDLILPVWHQVGLKEILKYSPPLGDKKAASSSDGINSVLRELTKRIRPVESPLVIAKNYLLLNKVETPPITDEWWLDVVEYKEYLKYPDTNMGAKWIFPLPHPHERKGKQRGINIASTAMQMDWSFDGEQLKISQFTHPEKVHDFLRKWPGLIDCAKKNPGTLALYAPQLTIPNFDMGFEKIFDELLDPKREDAYTFVGYGQSQTIDQKKPLCGELIALRHPTFGNYTASQYAFDFINAHDSYYFRTRYTTFDTLVWLLSNNSLWLTERIRAFLIQGIKETDNWIREGAYGGLSHLQDALWTKSRNQFRLTSTLRKELVMMVEESCVNLDIKENTELIASKIIDHNFFDSYYDFQDHWKSLRKKTSKKIKK